MRVLNTAIIFALFLLKSCTEESGMIPYRQPLLLRKN